jgi:5-methyltetrahydrofolate--homocysteine methyltransferase
LQSFRKSYKDFFIFFFEVPMTRPSFTEALNSRPWLLADGATGTNYFQMGLVSGDAPEMWNFEHPERVRALHRRFIEAGADIVLTHSFGGSHRKLPMPRTGAKSASPLAPRPMPRPWSSAARGGNPNLRPVGTMSMRTASMPGRRNAEGGGVDVLWIETMSSERSCAPPSEAPPGRPSIVYHI